MIFFLYVLLFLSPATYPSERSLGEIDRLFLDRKTSKRDQEKNIELLLPALENIKSHTIIDVVFTLPRLCREHKGNKICKGTYAPFNPSIMKTDEGYILICRTSNYKLPTYGAIFPGVQIQNKNVFLQYDKNFNLVYEQEIPLIADHLTKNIKKSHQMEDCRLFSFDGGCWMVGTVYTQGRSSRPKVALSRLNCFENNALKAVQSLTVFYEHQKRWEKNWMPLVDEGKLKFIYSYDPFIVLEPNIKDGTCKKLLSYTPALNFSRFRGSAAPIEFDDGYLMMVHERVREWDYIHRFLYLDKSFHITKISLPFKFEGINVEFCTSMTLDHEEKNLIMPVGLYDSRARIYLADLHYVRGLLHDIPLE